MDRAAAARAYAAARASGPPLDPAWRVTVHFHPDREVAGRSVLRGLADRGRYLSQFETATSNGGLTAHPGGDRHRWESAMFGGVYDDGPAAERPIYGSLNHRRRAAGGSPRFGSAHLRLTVDVLARCTFCYPDSAVQSGLIGVHDRNDLTARADAGERDRLDDYVEAQVHGPLLIARHVEALVLDPSHRGTATETEARALGCPVEWHPGFECAAAELDLRRDYRTAEAVELGHAIAEGGLLTPRILGDAARAGRDPQRLKHLWHLLARFGRAAEPASGRSPWAAG